jgi:hypothetical protein
MKPLDFCYWLQGYFEITGNSGTISAEQYRMIKEHLASVFTDEIMKSPSIPLNPITKEQVDKITEEFKYYDNRNIWRVFPNDNTIGPAIC